MTTPDRILAAVCELFGVSLADIRDHRRNRRLTPARQAAAHALRQTDLSLSEIGDLLDRDHTTIIYSIRAAEQRATRDSAYAARLRTLAAVAGATEPPPAPPARPVGVTPVLRWYLWASGAGIATPRTA